ncbi:MAG: NAD-dependent epimerase/dehydratase family protein [Rhodanobacteraceae bacterium]
MTPASSADASRSTVALTGAAGFIGTEVVRQLVGAGYAVRALYRPRAGRTLPQIPGVFWQPGEVGDKDALAALVRGAEAVVHCAGVVRGARRADFDRVNELGVRNTVEAASREEGCNRFLLISSLAAREPHLSDYAGSKRRGELALASHSGQLTWGILRPPAVYGPGDREMRPLFEAMKHGWAAIPGDGKGRFSLLHVADLASAIVAWLRADIASGSTHAPDDGHERGYDWDTVLDIASNVLRNGAPIRKLLIPTPVLRFVARINRAAAIAFAYAPMLTPGKVREISHADWVSDDGGLVRATGWRPAFGLERGLAQTFPPVARSKSEAIP